MRKDGEQPEEFVTKERLRQGGAWSPILFVMIMDDVVKEIKSKIKQTCVGCKCLETVSIGGCMFENRRELKYNLILWKEALQKRNVNINMGKTKIMILDGEKSVEIEMEGIKLEPVKSFKYLGLQIQNNGKQEAEVNERISTAMKIYYTLNRNF